MELSTTPADPGTAPEPGLDQVRRLLRAVSRALAEGGGAEAVLQACCQALVDHLDAAFARIWTVEEGAASLQLRASAGIYTRLDGRYSEVGMGRLKIGQIASERAPHLTNDVVHDPRIEDHDWAQAEGMVAFAGHPLVVDDSVVGVMAMFARHPVPDAVLDELAFVAGTIGQFIDRDNAAARERTRLAQELHDTVSQDLYGIALAAQTGLKNPRGTDNPRLEQVLDLTERAQAELRGILLRVRPDSIGPGGLGQALRELTAAFSARHRVPVTTTIEVEPPLGAAAAQNVYRVAQEALSNIARHAHAGAAELTLRATGARSHRIEVTDDGRGFDPGQDRPGHLGLKTMAARAAARGWTLDVQSSPGAGTRVRLDF